MRRYLVGRLAFSFLVVFGVVTIVFFLTRLSGDPVLLYLREDSSPAQVQAFRREHGFDQPTIVQYVRYLDRVLLHFDFGESLRHQRPAATLVTERLRATGELATSAMLVSLLIAVPLGVLSAVYKDSLLDTLARLLALIGQSTPLFWWEIILILLFAVRLRYLPSFGRGGIQHLILPSLALGTFTAGVIMRILRAEVITVLSQDYIRTARAKGLSNQTVYVRHALKNAGIPVVTLAGLQLGSMLGGVIITEFVFAYPGIGRLALAAIFDRDFPVVQAFSIFSGVVMVTVNLCVDLLYGVLDPRIRYG